MLALSDLQSWIIPWAVPAATIAAAFLAARPVFREIRLKEEAEKRLAEAGQVESDARLLATFVELMGKAHSRGTTTLSESAVEGMINRWDPKHPLGLEELNNLVGAAVATHPVGAAEAEAAIAAVAELGSRYEVLRGPAIAGLESIATWHKKSPALPKALAKLGVPTATADDPSPAHEAE